MFEKIIDNECIEVQKPTTQDGLGFIDDEIIFKKEKILRKNGEFFEIHHGISKKYPLEYKKSNIRGSFYHGLFHDEKFKKHREKTIDSFVGKMRNRVDVKKILKSVC
jgi:adenosylcobyric acid synthase